MHEAPIIQLAGLNIDLSAVLMLLVSCSIVFFFVKAATKSLSVENPGKLQNFLEWVVEFVQDLIGGTMNMKIGRKFISLGVTLLCFIFVSNMLGLPFAIVTEHNESFSIFGHHIVTTAQANHNYEVGLLWWKSPTADPSVALGLAFVIFCMVHSLGIIQNRRAYLKHYIEPHWLFLPINIIEQFAKLLTHGMRLFGNIFAGEVLLSVLAAGGVLAIPGFVIWQGFSTFIGAIQAFVFTILTMVYLSQSLTDHSADH